MKTKSMLFALTLVAVLMMAGVGNARADSHSDESDLFTVDTRGPDDPGGISHSDESDLFTVDTRDPYIPPVQLVVTPTAGQSKILGAFDPVLTYVFEGALEGEAPAFTGALSREQGEEVGAYAITQGTLALADNGRFLAANYVLVFAGGATFEITPNSHSDESDLFTVDTRDPYIPPVQLVVTPTEGQSKILGAQDPVLAYTFAGALEGEAPAFTGALSREPGEAVGAYAITQGTLALADNGAFLAANYVLVFDGGATFEITPNSHSAVSRLFTVDTRDPYIPPVELVVMPTEGQSKILGAQDPVLAYIFEGALEGETPAFTGALSREPGEAVGAYAITQGTLALADNGAFLAANYALTFTEGVTFEITPNSHSAVSGLFTVDTRDPYIPAVELVVTPTEGQSKILGAQDPVLAYTFAGVLEGEAPAFTGALSREPGEAVGAYAITQGTLALADNGRFLAANYVLVFDGGATFEITPNSHSAVSGLFTVDTRDPYIPAVQLVVTPTAGQSKNLGAFDPVLTYVFEGALEGEKPAFTGALAREKGETAGTYAITQGTLALADNGAFLAANYALTFTEGVTFEITSNAYSAVSGLFTVDTRNPYIPPVQLVVTPTEGQSKNLGAFDPVLTYIFEGALEGEKPAFTGALAREQGETAGTYPITQGTLALVDNGAFLAANYALTFTEGVTFEITSNAYSAVSGLFTVDTRDPYIPPVELVVTPTAGQSKILGAQDPILAYTFAGALEGEKPVFTGALARKQGETVGSYEITQGNLALADNGAFLAANYALTFTEGVTFEITPNAHVAVSGLFTVDTRDPYIPPVELVVTPTAGQSKIFGTLDPVLTYTFDGELQGEKPVFTGALSREQGEAVGSYEITQGNLALVDNGPFLAANYVLVFDGGATFEITPNDVINSAMWLTATALGSGEEDPITLFFGENEAAAEGEDDLDVAAIPGQSVRLCSLPTFTGVRRLSHDWRPFPGKDGITRWRLEVVQPGTIRAGDEQQRNGAEDNKAFTLTWNIDAAEQNRHLYLQQIMDEQPVGFPIDMRRTSTTTVHRGTVYEIAYAPLVEAEINLKSGWNFIGSPLMSTQSQGEILGGAAPIAGSNEVLWYWNNGRYEICQDNEPLNPERGYFVYSHDEKNRTISITGIKTDAVMLLQQGWNLVNPPNACAMPTKPGVLSRAWHLNGDAYQFVAQGGILKPDCCYWIFVTSNEPAMMNFNN